MKCNNRYIFLILVFISVNARAGTLSPPELYARCYSHIVGERVKPNDTLLAQVKSSSMTYVDACMSLLSKANLDGSGVVSAKIGPDPDPIAQRILQTFNNFHNSWFSIQSFSECEQNELHDNQEMSYHVSNILFNNKPFSEMITSSQTYAGIRISPSSTINNRYRTCEQYRDSSKIRYVSQVNTVPTYNVRIRAAKWSPYIPEVGTLVGIRPMPDEDFIPYIQGHNIYALPDPFENYDQSAPNFLAYSKNINCCGVNGFDKSYIQTPTSIKPHSPYGAGVIGTVPYFLLNNGRGNAFKPDGVIQLPRRWSKSVLRDVLCRELPVLRSGDVAADVVASSPTPFRASNSCMRCHNTMDPLAYGVRNLSTANTRNYTGAPTNFIDEFGATYMYDMSATVYDVPDSQYVRKYPVKYAENPTFLRATSDADFYLKPPVGKFNYRDIYGTLHGHQFTDLTGASGLGNYLKDLDDLYVCAAKRYYQYFTGIDVPIYDFADPSMAKASNEEILHRSFVIQMGKNLKSSQKLQLLIKEILSSDQYKKQGFGKK